MPKEPLLLRLIDSVGDWTGKLISFLMSYMVGVMIYSVVRRYLFNSPWNYMKVIPNFFLTYVVMGAAYVMHSGQFINVDILQQHMSPKTRAVIDVITSLFFFIFCLALVYSTSRIALMYYIPEFGFGSKPFLSSKPPYSFVLPIGSFLLLLQGLAKLIRDIMTIASKREAE